VISGPLVFAIGSYALMVWAFQWGKRRYFHIPVMVSLMLIDLAFPVYLILTKDWYQRLIEHEELLSFMVWMHFILVLVLYALYVVQILTARKLLKGDESVRPDHRSQGKGILIARALMILSAAMLIEPVTK
jgi:hypothetical protein